MGECAHVTYHTIFLAEKNNMNKNWMRMKIWRYSEKILYIDMSSAGLVLCYGSKIHFCFLFVFPNYCPGHIYPAFQQHSCNQCKFLDLGMKARIFGLLMGINQAETSYLFRNLCQNVALRMETPIT